MKTFITLLIVTLISTSFVKIDNQKITLRQHTLDGTWELISRYNFDGENVSDTIHDPEGYRQIKMYSNGKVMWTRFVPEDSTEWFGYGSYSNTEDRLVETLEYGSSSIMKIIDTMRVFSFELQLEKDHFKQITLDEEGNRIFSENYKRIK